MRLKWLVMIAVLLPLLIAPIAPLLNVEAQQVSLKGDTDKICVVVQSYPGTDKFGKPSVNPDGTFYPNDQLWVKYSVYTADGFSFDGVEASYDQSAFERLRDAGWGTLSGETLFEVKADAAPGTYTFTVKAKGSSTSEAASGTVEVTYGGASVDAYYRAECMLTISTTPGGTTNPAPGSYWHTEGTAASVTAIADSNYVLDHWLLDGQNAGANNPVTVTMDSPHTLKAVFRKVQYSLTVSVYPSNGGTTFPPPGTFLYDANTQVQVSAAPNANYTFSCWALDGGDAGTSNPITVTMDKSHTLTAIFAEQGQAGSRAAGSRVLLAEAKSPVEPKLVIKDLKWTTWLDLFRGTVCQATGYLYDSNGRAIPCSDVTVEFRKKNFWTGAVWVSAKTVRANSAGYFAADDACNPLAEQFLGVEAWAEKAGYIPSWTLTLALNPSSASVGQGGGFIAGVEVLLDGRYTPVPVTLSASGLPRGCTASFDPAAGSVEGAGWFQSVMLLKAQPSAPIGTYAFTVTVSSGAVSDSRQFSLELTEPLHIPSAVTFTAHGLDADASGVALTLDSAQQVYADQLPYTANWDTNTQHTYAWSAQVSSSLNGKRYVLEKAVATVRYLSVATVTVEVVKYDPHFTLVLAYTVPKSPGNNSYEKPFAMIIRYDGNGPEKNLGQRAVIEGWKWYGYASRVSAQQQLTGLTEISNAQDLLKNMQQLIQLFNLSSGVQFTAAGMDAKTDGVMLKVDGEKSTFDQLPKTYNWPANTTHAYEWTLRMPVYKWVRSPMWGTGYYEEADDEWFGFEYALVAIPELKVGANATEEQLQQLAQSFSAKLYSPSGEINATGFGNCVTGVYSHNRLLTSIASDAGVANGTHALSCLEPNFPVFFNNESRYAKFIFDLDDRVAAEAISQTYNSSIFYEVSFLSSAFTTNVFKANFTCPLEYYQKPVNITAVRWDPAGERWVVDPAVRVEAFFDTAFNFTEEEWFKDYFKDQTVDETALKMACEDVYECLPQYYGGLGSAESVMNRTSPYYYDLNVTAGCGHPYVGVEPADRDAFTEAVRTYRAVWDSPSCSVSADSSRRTAGAAGIKVESSDVSEACTFLNLVKPVEAFAEGEPSMWGKLFFDVYLGDGCSGEMTVTLQTSAAQVSFNETVPVGSWNTVSVPAAGSITKVGIYCELTEPSGTFWVDHLYFAKAWLWNWTDGENLKRTVYVNFATDSPYQLYVNMDPLSPLGVNVTRDDVKSCDLTVSALPQLGGLQNVTVYLVTYAPTGYSLKGLPIEKLQLKPILARNLTAEQAAVDSAWYYQGYAPTYAGSTLGFEGDFSLSIIKDPEFKALQGYNSTLLLIEVENVWGTTFHTVVAVQPWGKTFWEIVFEQIALVLVGLAIAACIISLVIRLLKRKMP